MSHRTRTIIVSAVGIAALLAFIFLAWSIAVKNIFYTSTLVSLDTNLNMYTRSHLTVPQANFFLFFTSLANIEIIVLALVVISLILFLIRERITAAFFVGALGLGSAFSLFFKNLFLRPRPLDQVFVIAHRGFAFPSGHALISIIFYGFLGYILVHSFKKRWLKIIITIVTILVIFLIGVSRVYLGVHWATDVVGGWLLGGALLSGLILLFRMVHRKISLNISHISAKSFPLIALILVIFAFGVFTYYVTQAVELRSTRDSLTQPIINN
jgi:undecaprenyl-diphosphatase